LDSLAAVVSIALQHGVPLSAIVHKLAYQRFEPSGHVSHPEIKHATSIVDYIARWLGFAFIQNYAQTEDHGPRLSDLSAR
jgi:ribonucleoside-diphosphate reductase alpha chain